MDHRTELLAPAGTWDMLEAAIAEGADALYLGGKKFNMRLHRQDVNFDDSQLAKAVQYAHKHKVKLYVTINNLLTDDELKDARSYLEFLRKIQPDALIIQDFGLLQLIKELDINIPLHASVMMNVHNVDMVRLLQKLGINRIIFGKELSLEQISRIHNLTGIEAEYFTHGDMCISHSGQCIHSGVVFGHSSNRGRCLKPCRWPYTLIDCETGREQCGNDPGPFKLAMKDLCLYNHLPEMIQAGVYSFKIEGRMRTAEYMRQIIRLYRRALDRYTADPTGYHRDATDWQALSSLRVRDFTTCFAFKNPGAASIGYGGEREPRSFSEAIAEPSLSAIQPASLHAVPAALSAKPQLAIRVGNYVSFREALTAGADCIYIGGETFLPDTPWSLDQISEAVQESAGKVRVVVAAPRITMQRELNEIKALFRSLEAVKPAGIIVANAGTLHAAAEISSLPLYADFPMNCFNTYSVRQLQKLGVSQVTLSLELPLSQAGKITGSSPIAIEWLVHGGIPAMVLEHCVPAAMLAHSTKEDSCPSPCRDRRLGLRDAAGHIHPIYIDQHCRNHILLGLDLCLFPMLQEICRTGVRSLRIEGQYYRPHAIGSITRIYRAQLDALWADPAGYNTPEALMRELTEAGGRELGAGVFRFNKTE